jgi:glucokinase
LEGVHLRPLLTAEFGEVVYCDMDTNAATIAELHLGGGRDHDRVLVAVLGTGISCGVAIGGRLLRYSFGTAGDLGHLIVETVSGVRCACGGTGCLETVATAGGIERLFRQAPRDQGSAESPALTYDPDPDFPAILEAARSGDLVARAVLSTAGRYLGFALASMVNIYSPQIILVGGGIAEAGDLLLRSARETVADAASAYHLAYLAGINQCALRADAGVVGAAALVLFGS